MTLFDNETADMVIVSRWTAVKKILLCKMMDMTYQAYGWDRKFWFQLETNFGIITVYVAKELTWQKIHKKLFNLAYGLLVVKSINIKVF